MLSGIRTSAWTFLAVCFLAFPVVAFEIDHIEFRKGIGFLIHFDTEPNWTYHLQSINRLTCTTNFGCSRSGVQTNAWLTIETFEASPFPGHFIYADQRAVPPSRQRYYRLMRVRP